jgi:signal transduction histidine kinase
VHPDYHGMMVERRAMVLDQGQIANLAEMRHVRLDGSSFPSESAAIPFEFQGGAALQIVIFDITARKEVERARLRLNAELEERVQERTTALRRVNQELSEFSYIVSHDLKAPLRGIASLVNWLEQDHAAKLGEEGRELLRLLSARSRRMHRLIEDILHFSRLGRTREDPEEVDLEALVAEVADSLAIPDHIEVRIENGLPRVIGEETRLRQVFQNLISNAVKFMDQPRGLITIGGAADEREGEGMWRFHVSDNGPGIDPRHQERIFEIFQTLNLRNNPDSTGIGLTVVKKIVKLMEGRIWVESQPGQGARFVFTMRLAVTESSAAAAGAPAEHGSHQ